MYLIAEAVVLVMGLNLLPSCHYLDNMQTLLPISSPMIAFGVLLSLETVLFFSPVL